jgi:AraC-like DNA-binding protein
VLLRHAGPVSVGELARQVKSSKFYLNRLFRKVMGKPPGRLHRQWRLAFAAELLLSGKPPCDVAAELEFADQAHFTRLFGKQFGTTPARYAKNH